MPSKKKKMTIILCAGRQGRAVIIGDVDKEPTPGESVRLTDARMVLFWDAECGGLLGLAANGPQGATRITSAVAVTVETAWQEWCSVSAKAKMEIDKWPAY